MHRAMPAHSKVLPGAQLPAGYWRVPAFSSSDVWSPLAEAKRLLLNNEGAGQCLPASCYQAFKIHCTSIGKNVPANLPQNADEMRQVLVDYLVAHEEFYTLDDVWQFGDSDRALPFHEFIAEYRKSATFISSIMLPVFAALMKEWTSDISLNIVSTPGRVLIYDQGSPSGTFTHVAPINIREQTTEMQARVPAMRLPGKRRHTPLKTTCLGDFQGMVGHVPIQQVLADDIVICNSVVNVHWQYAIHVLHDHEVTMLPKFGGDGGGGGAGPGRAAYHCRLSMEKRDAVQMP